MKIETAVRNCSTSKATACAKAVKLAFQCRASKYMYLMFAERRKTNEHRHPHHHYHSLLLVYAALMTSTHIMQIKGNLCLVKSPLSTLCPEKRIT